MDSLSSASVRTRGSDWLITLKGTQMCLAVVREAVCIMRASGIWLERTGFIWTERVPTANGGFLFPFYLSNSHQPLALPDMQVNLHRTCVDRYQACGSVVVVRALPSRALLGVFWAGCLWALTLLLFLSREDVLNTNEIEMVSSLKKLIISLGRCFQSRLYNTRK